MPEDRVTQQYYIATKSSPVDDRAQVLKYGRLFSVFDHLGDIQTSGLGEQGLFFEGTRHLSELLLGLWNARPLPLSSTIETNNFLFRAHLTNLDVSKENQVVIPRGMLHLQRSIFLWRDVCYQEFAFVNYGLQSLLVPFSLTVGADFADIFEVRGMQRQKRGSRLEDRIEKHFVLLSYEGLDKTIRQTRIQCDPAPTAISASAIQFEVNLQPREKLTFHLEISCDSHVVPNSIGYSRAIGSARGEQEQLSETFPQICSSNSRFNDWIGRSASDVQMMTIGNPEVNYPYAGVPWFSTVFGRDGIITALQMLWCSPWIAHGVLQYLAKTQAKDFDPAIESEPGKILHEMRNGEMAALGEIPFGRYYGSVDSTPLFIVLAGAYYDRTGDRDFLQQLWPHIDLALQWIDQRGDMDGDGFVEYAQRSPKGLVQQGWKDSNDSVFHVNGTLAEAPIALCEVQGYVYAAKRAAARLSNVLGDKEKCKTLESEAEKLRMRFEEAFWCDELSTYVLALDGHKKQCRVRTSNAGHCLYTGIATANRARRVAETLMSADSFSGWGVRTLAAGQARYNPLSYHNGSIWPHDNSIVACGLARYGFKEKAGRILLAMLDTSRWADLGRLPELFCGLDRHRGQGPTLYPVACSPQAWAAGAAFLLIQSCLGLSIEGIGNRVLFDRPYLPAGIPQLTIKGLRSGDGSVDVFVERQDGAVRCDVTDQQGEIEVVSLPVVGDNERTVAPFQEQ
ncbi:MAG: glycoside hydrolase [Candidatus Sulfotelmatobacter sp.]|nr:glycoside hydrolase [Candidatus Sulfotelmatobacter sp.]